MEYIFIAYPKCSTCQKAKKQLDLQNVIYKERHIKEENPTYEELKKWSSTYHFPMQKFFNTSGVLYREMKLKEKTKEMTDDEKAQILATDGMLVKRPILISDKVLIVGYSEEKYRNL